MKVRASPTKCQGGGEGDPSILSKRRSKTLSRFILQKPKCASQRVWGGVGWGGGGGGGGSKDREQTLPLCYLEPGEYPESFEEGGV